MSALRIAFDGRTLTSPAAGVRRYTAQLFAALATNEQVELVAVGANASTVPPGVRAAPGGISLPTNLGWAATGLPVGAARCRADLFHAPAYTAPLWGTRPLVVTIHDVSYARHPEWYPYRVGAARQQFYRASARRADRIITDSSFSRDEIMAAYGIPADHIDVVPLGVSPGFTEDASVPREPIVLHVGDLHRRRNLRLLLEAVIALRRIPDHTRLRLVLVGRDRGELELLRADARAAQADEAFVHVPEASDAELTSWYRRAAVLAYPSLYEGFGLPLIEAMACGTPVVAARAGSLPEVGGAAALIVDPHDVAAWRDALDSVLAQPARAAAMSADGLRHAAEFSWRRTARETLASYRKALESRGVRL